MFNKEKNFISAVVYVYNAENRIKEYTNMLMKALSNNFEHSEIIFVNDFSLDKSGEVIKNTVKELNKTINDVSVTIINLSFFHGLEMAMSAGEDLAIGDFVFEFDNTILDYDENIIMNVYKKSLEDIDVVSAAPKRSEKFSSKLFYNIYNNFSNNNNKMHTESFRIISRRVINRIDSMNKTIPYRKAVYLSSGLKTFLYEYEPINRINVKLDKKEKRFRLGLAMDTLILFTDFGFKISSIMTGIMMLISVIVAIYSVFIYLAKNPVAGWTTTIMFLSLAFFGLFLILSIIIKYLQLIINLVFKRKNYSYENIEKLTS